MISVRLLLLVVEHPGSLRRGLPSLRWVAVFHISPGSWVVFSPCILRQKSYKHETYSIWEVVLSLLFWFLFVGRGGRIIRSSAQKWSPMIFSRTQRKTTTNRPLREIKLRTLLRGSITEIHSTHKEFVGCRLHGWLCGATNPKKPQ